SPALARRLCDRRAGVGADGLLAVSGRRVVYLNADGSRAFCGNGARCAAWWLRSRGRGGTRFALSGVPVEAVVGAASVRIRMPDVRPLRRLRVAAEGRDWDAAFLDTGVPHAVVRVGALDRFPVVRVGRALRRHRAFGRAGANADFVSGSGRTLRLRTYERGVEDETLACGTGAVAAALAFGRASPVTVRARGGRLTVSFRAGKDGGFTDVWLEGPVRQTFTGEVVL
ncbi:MAG: diaminopimelate epimerase, partial [Elusimicrobia bacterium]|nr:diaminopimelate epimerase [Elusimicrobiota bacterium]